MNKNKFFIFLVGALLVTNIVLIFFLIKGRDPRHDGPPPHHRGRPKDLIIERLHFNEAQTQQFEKLIKEHQKDIANEDEALMNIKNKLYNNLKAEENKMVTDSLITAMTAVQNKIEHIHYVHFENIKKLCKPEQLNDFNELASELSHLFGPHKQHPDGPPRP